MQDRVDSMKADILVDGGCCENSTAEDDLFKSLEDGESGLRYPVLKMIQEADDIAEGKIESETFEEIFG